MFDEEDYNEEEEDQFPYIELVGGPFCGAYLRATIETLSPGGTINTPCSQKDSNQSHPALDAIYRVDNDSKAVFLMYGPTQFGDE